MEIADGAGSVLRLAEPPRRIVSLVPSLTETLFTLGAGDRVVAATRYCTDPRDAIATVPRVGGTKNPDCAAIVALAPDLVVMNAEENRREDHAVLRDAGLPVLVTDVRTVDAGIAVIEDLGRIVGCETRGREIAAAQIAARDALAWRPGPRVRYFCPIWRNPWMTFNADTYAHDLLRLVGGENVAASHAERYPRVELDAIAAARPRIVLLPSEPYRFGPRDVPAAAVVLADPATAARRVHCVDGQALTWYGPRIAEALRTFAALVASGL